MNRQKLIQTAQRKIDERRFAAEAQRNRLLERLRANSEYKKCEHNLRMAQVKYAMQDGENKSDTKLLLDKCKSEFDKTLSNLNLTEQDLLPKYNCTKCNDTGYIGKAACKCLVTEIRNLLLTTSNIIDTNCTFDNLTDSNAHNTAVIKKAKEVSKSAKGNLLIIGNTGTGKTSLMLACANLAINLDKSVLFYTAYNLNSLFLESHLSDLKLKNDILNTLTDTDILIIDDLGTEIIYKNVTAEYLFAVINERIARGKQTFVSTNLTLLDIRDRYDERIFSRLVDQNCTFVAELIGEDKRLANKQSKPNKKNNN